MSTSIEALAQSIINLTIAGPIPGGVGANIRADAEMILAAFEWVDCADRLPTDPSTSYECFYRNRMGCQFEIMYWDGDKFTDSDDRYSLSNPPTHWRESTMTVPENKL